MIEFDTSSMVLVFVVVFIVLVLVQSWLLFKLYNPYSVWSRILVPVPTSLFLFLGINSFVVAYDRMTNRLVGSKHQTFANNTTTSNLVLLR